MFSVIVGIDNAYPAIMNYFRYDVMNYHYYYHYYMNLFDLSIMNIILYYHGIMDHGIMEL